MTAFAVFLEDHSLKVHSQISERIRSQYPGTTEHFKLSDNLYLVRSDSIADAVARAVGIKGDDLIENATGIVFRLNTAYAGFASRSIWEWLELAESA